MPRLKTLTWMILLAVALLPAGALLAETGSWSGEVIDVTCYKSRGAHGEGHASCGTRCVKNGEPMGLLTDDGTVVLLEADADAPEPHEKLMEMVGKQVKVSGTLSERDGMKVVTVSAAEAS